MENLISEIKSRYENYVRIPIRDFTIGISNLRRWLPIVWKDRDWDKHYLMEPLLFKLRNHIEYTKNHGHLASGPDQIRSMTECLELLEKVHGEWTNYEYPEILKHEARWGKSDFYSVKCENRPGIYVLKDRNDERYTEQELNIKRQSTLMASRIAHNKRKRDFEVAMEIFVKNFDSWWD